MPHGPAPSRRPTLTTGDVCVSLGALTVERRRAILFALESGITLPQTMQLDRPTALLWGRTKLAKELVQVQPAHIQLRYAFWEFIRPGIPAALFGLENSFRESFPYPFEFLAAHWPQIVWFDAEAEREAFCVALRQI